MVLSRPPRRPTTDHSKKGFKKELADRVLRERRARVIQLLAQTAGDPHPTDVDVFLKKLGAEGFQTSRPTFYRDLAAIRAENERRLAEKSPIEFLVLAQATYQGAIRQMWADYHRVDGEKTMSAAQRFYLRNKIMNDILERTGNYISLQQKLGLIPPAPLEPGQIGVQVAVSIIVDAISRMNPDGSLESDLTVLAQLRAQAKQDLPKPEVTT